MHQQGTKRLEPHGAYSATLTRLNSQLEIMFKFFYLALTRLNSHYLAQTRTISPLPSGYQF